MITTEKFDEIYATRWLKAEDLPAEGSMPLTIMDVNAEALGEKKEMKFVLEFRELVKSLALNVTNARTLADLFGKNPNEWIGKRIGVYSTEVAFAGKMHDAVRISTKLPPQEQPQEQPVQPAEASEEVPY